MDLDLIVIGGGTAGINVAIKGGLKKSEVGAMHYVFPTLGGAIFDTMPI
jgi:hypothetical protein